MVDNDGFVVVKSKRSAKKKSLKISDKDQIILKEDPLVDISKTKKSIKFAVEDLRSSSYLKELLRSVSINLECHAVVEIVCFGLGNIGNCKIAQYQLALLLCLKEICSPKKTFVHDPIFSKTECEILKIFEIQVIEQNNEGIYPLTLDGATLLFLPHCPKQLTNNFLWSNWGLNLRNCILVCNSFSSLLENQPSRIILESVPYIHKIFPYTKETIICNTFKFTDIFNDLSIHSFPSDKLVSIDPSFWVKGDKPTYNNNEEFITSLMIEKLNL